MAPQSNNHNPRAPSNTKSKTIKPPGSNTTRVSVACDRCRKKKIRCFYDNDDLNNGDDNCSKKQCANCKLVGLECIFTDKLARKAFPRGYTESLEERVRELEYENKKLQKLLTLKTSDQDIIDDSQSNSKVRNSSNTTITSINNAVNDSFGSRNSPNIHFGTGINSINNTSSTIANINGNINVVNSQASTPNDNNTGMSSTPMSDNINISNSFHKLMNDNTQNSQELNMNSSNSDSNNNNNNNDTGNNNANDLPNMLNIENISKLENFKSDFHTHDENCNCGMHHSVINRPVSIAGSVDIDQGDLSDDDSLYSNDGVNGFYSRQNSLLNHNISNVNGQSKLGSPVNYNPNANNHFNANTTNNNTNIPFTDNLNDNNNYNPSNSDNHSFNSNNDINDSNSFEQINAPGAAAAISLQNKLRTKNFLNLANLIAASIPRSTEETLFIPSLLTRIIKTHGFDSKAPYLTARSIALLKQAYNEDERYNLFPITFKGINFNDLNKNESSMFFKSLNLPNNMNLDICITIFFNTWNTIIPILNKEIFMENYKKFIKSRDNNFSNGDLVGFEKFGELLVIITCLVMISNEKNNIINKTEFNPNNLNDTNIKLEKNENKNTSSLSSSNSTDNLSDKNSSNKEILQFYDHLIKQLIQSNMSSACSISSLQIITIELLYCLTTDDLTTSYELRGRMITMCQQLRLHRCPAAVLGSNGSSVSKLQQGERRILFWCIYTLDSFSAFILGVPRLLKDYEIECALPSSANGDNEDENGSSLITFKNNIQLKLVGKVCDSALSVMRYSKILGTIVDSIFKRSEGLKQTNINESKCLIMEDLLESWKRNLPNDISFNCVDNSKDINIIDNLNETQLTLYYLYYQAKALIYMPLLASENSISNKCSPAFITIQQSTTSILTTMKILNTPKHNYYNLPLPINIARQMARFSLLAARNSLEYTRGGSLFQEAKNLLNYIINELKFENKIGLLGCLSDSCISFLEHSIDAILSQPKSNSSNSSPTNNNNNGFNEINGLINNSNNNTNNNGINSKRKSISIGSPLKNNLILNNINGNKTISSIVKKSSPLVQVKNEEEEEEEGGRGRGRGDDDDEIRDEFNNVEMKDVVNENQLNRNRQDDKSIMNNMITHQKIALNDIFSSKESVNDARVSNNNNNNNNNNNSVSNSNSNNNEYLIKERNKQMLAKMVKTEIKEDDLFNFMSNDPTVMEEESLNMILNNEEEDLNNLSIDKQQELIKQKQIFLETQKQNLQKQIQTLKNARIQKSKNVRNLSNEGFREEEREERGERDEEDRQERINEQVHLQQQNELNELLQDMNNMNSVKSFSDLLMLNDFGVDASLGLPLDFELDTNYDNINTSGNKKQKISHHNELEVDSNIEGMSYMDSPNYNPYINKEVQLRRELREMNKRNESVNVSDRYRDRDRDKEMDNGGNQEQRMMNVMNIKNSDSNSSIISMGRGIIDYQMFNRKESENVNEESKGGEELAVSNENDNADPGKSSSGSGSNGRVSTLFNWN